MADSFLQFIDQGCCCWLNQWCGEIVVLASVFIQSYSSGSGGVNKLLWGFVQDNAVELPYNFNVVHYFIQIVYTDAPGVVEAN